MQVPPPRQTIIQVLKSGGVEVTLAGRSHTGEEPSLRKSTLMMGLRALMFGVLAFAMLALMRIQVNSALDVAGFVLGAAALWYLIELVVFRAKSKAPRKGR